MKKARYIPVGWYQLKHQKFRMIAALAGITFAVILMLVQQAFRTALFESSVRWHRAIDYDLVLVSPKTTFLLRTAPFPRTRLIQAQGVEGVEAVTPLYTRDAEWRNPLDPSLIRQIFVLGFDPHDRGFADILSPRQHEVIRLPDHVLFDALSRPEYGPIPKLLRESEELSLEANGRTVSVSGLFEIGTSFGLDGALITSDLNFLRLFPQWQASHLTLGLVHLADGVDRKAVQAELEHYLEDDVLILSQREFSELEIAYWNSSTPIGYVFTFGVIMGFVVGMIIVYQVLYSDVQDHLQEYATLKAMGYSNGYLSRVVLQEAVILAVAGFIPGAAGCFLFLRKGQPA